jgi:protein TonB
MITDGLSQQRHHAQQLGPLGLVILLHVAFFFALQSGLSQQTKTPQAREIIATLIAAQPASAPKSATPAPQPEPPKPHVQPKPEQPKPHPTPKPVKQAAKPEPAPEPTPKSISKPAETAPAPAPATPPTPAATAPSAPATATEPNASASQSGPAQPKTVTSGLEYISQPPREYPAISRRLGEEGTVTLRILVNDKGHVDQVDIRKSSGVPRLDEAARKWALRVVFKPYMENGKPIPVFAVLPITFNLNS